MMFSQYFLIEAFTRRVKVGTLASLPIKNILRLRRKKLARTHGFSCELFHYSNPCFYNVAPPYHFSSNSMMMAMGSVVECKLRLLCDFMAHNRDSLKY